MIDKISSNIYNSKMQKFGENIRKLRKEHGWSQATLAKKAGELNVETINRIECGRNTTTRNLYKIAVALKVPIGELLPEDERAILKHYHSVCPENNPDHIAYHKMAERILHSGNEKLINIMMAGLQATALQLDSDSNDKSQIKQKHPSFNPDALITPRDQ